MDEPTQVAPAVVPEQSQAQSADMAGQVLQQKRTKIASDVRFRQLSAEEQATVLSRIDPEFAAMDQAHQQELLGVMRQGALDRIKADYLAQPKTGMDKAKDIAGETIGMGAEVAGAVKGAQEGVKVGARFGPYGALAGGVGGAAIGAMAGHVARVPTDVLLQEKPIPTGRDLLTTTLTAGAFGAAGEGGGQALVAGWNKAVMEPLAQFLTRGKLTGKAGMTAEEQALATQAERMGVTLRPSEITGSDPAAMVEQNIRRSMFGRGYFDELDVKNSTALQGHLKNLMDRFITPTSVSQTQAGAMLQQTIEGDATPLFRATERQFYRRVSDLAGAEDVVIDATPILKDMQRLKETILPEAQPEAYKLIQKIESMVQETNVLQQGPKGSGIPTKTETVAKKLDWMDAQDIRSMLLELGRSRDLLKGKEQGLANAAAETIRRTMENTAKTAGSDVYGLWREAQEFSKGGHEVFDDMLIQRLVNVYPNKAVEIFFRPNSGPQNQRLLEALSYASPEGEKEALRQYQRAAMESIIDKASTDGFLTGRKLYNAIYGQRGIGKETMEAVFGSAYLKELDATLDVAKRMNMSQSAQSAGNPSQTARGLINWFETGMVIQIPGNFARSVMKGEFGQAIAGAAADLQQAGVYILSNREVGRILNSTEGLKLMREGMQVGAKGEKAGRIAAQLLAMAGAEFANEPAPPTSEPLKGEATTPRVQPLEQ